MFFSTRKRRRADMTFNEFCKRMIDEYDFHICDDTKYISYLENNVPDYRTKSEDFHYWYSIYEDNVV